MPMCRFRELTVKMGPVGGRHKAPSAAARASFGTRVRAALRRPGRHTPPTSVPAAPVWVLAEAAAVAVIVAVAEVLVVGAAHLIVDWREPLVVAALLFAPLAIRHVVLGVRHRWAAFAAGYVVLFGLGYLVLRGVEAVWSSTTGGFVAAGVGVLLCGVTFFLVSNVRRSRRTGTVGTGDELAASQASAPVDPASEPTGPLPLIPVDRDGAGTDPPTDPFVRLGEDPDTEALPMVGPDEERRAQ